VLTEDELEPDSAEGELSTVRPSWRRTKPGMAWRWRLPTDNWLTDVQRRRLGARRQLAQLVARQHGSVWATAASGAEARAAWQRHLEQRGESSMARSSEANGLSLLDEATTRRG
jgi:hypothetical protein